MSIPSAIVTKLLADTTLLALATGGIYAYSDTGRNGISQSSVPVAYDEDGYLLPTILVKERSEAAWGGINDIADRTTSMREVVEIYAYDEGDRTGTSVENMYQRLVRVLDKTFVTGAGRLKQINALKDLRDPDMNNALCNRADFQVVYVRRFTDG